MSLSSLGKNPLQILPKELNEDIFFKLPVKSLLRAECVSKQWNFFIRDIKLSYAGQLGLLVLSRNNGKEKRLTLRSICYDLRIQMLSHFEDPLFFTQEKIFGYIQEYGPSVLCSCNGAVLVAVGATILLWNPLTRWCKSVLQLKELTDLFYGVIAGMCYDTSTQDYKFIFLLRHISEDSGRVVLMSTLNNKQWQHLRLQYNLCTVRVGGVNFNNTFHWILTEDVKRPVDESHVWRWGNISGCNRIVYFDPTHDEFKTSSSPPPQLCNTEEDDPIIGLGIINQVLAHAVDGTLKMLLLNHHQQFPFSSTSIMDSSLNTPKETSDPSSKLVLYSYWQSLCSWRVRFALNLKGLSYE